MRKNVLILSLLILPFMAIAQGRNVKKMSFEFGSGYSFAANKSGSDEIKGLFGGYFEGRYNLENAPVNLGLHLGVTGFERTRNYSISNYMSFSTMVVGDYVFLRKHKINPFIGLGFGVSFSNYGEGIFNTGYITSVACMPRIGVRLLNHISLSLDYQVIQKDYSHANIRLGVFF